MPRSRYLNPCAKTIGWADYSWNPVTGCEHGPEICSCSDICWARGMARRFGKTEDEKNFKPAFHPERLEARFNKIPPSRIFVCDMGDLFGEWVTEEQIYPILNIANSNPQHQFLFLTKNPGRYKSIMFPMNAWIGTTITQASELNRIKLLVEKPLEGLDLKERFISFEPLLEKIGYDDLLKYDWHKIHWVIIGGFSGNRKQAKPDCHPAIYALYLRHFFEGLKIPVFVKDNLGWANPLKQFPEGLKI